MFATFAFCYDSFNQPPPFSLRIHSSKLYCTVYPLHHHSSCLYECFKALNPLIMLHKIYFMGRMMMGKVKGAAYIMMGRSTVQPAGIRNISNISAGCTHIEHQWKIIIMFFDNPTISIKSSRNTGRRILFLMMAIFAFISFAKSKNSQSFFSDLSLRSLL